MRLSNAGIASPIMKAMMVQKATEPLRSERQLQVSNGGRAAEGGAPSLLTASTSSAEACCSPGVEFRESYGQT